MPQEVTVYEWANALESPILIGALVSAAIYDKYSWYIGILPIVLGIGGSVVVSTFYEERGGTKAKGYSDIKVFLK
jgi:hypothetical protein